MRLDSCRIQKSLLLIFLVIRLPSLVFAESSANSLAQLYHRTAYNFIVRGDAQQHEGTMSEGLLLEGFSILKRGHIALREKEEQKQCFLTLVFGLQLFIPSL